MSFNQKMILLLTVFFVGITSAVTFVVFEPPYSGNFIISFGALILSEILFGAFWMQQIAKADSVLPMSLAVWGVNAGYFVFALIATLLTGLDEKFYVLIHMVGFALFVMAHLFFRIAEHHIEEQSKYDEPEQRIERAKVTWR